MGLPAPHLRDQADHAVVSRLMHDGKDKARLERQLAEAMTEKEDEKGPDANSVCMDVVFSAPSSISAVARSEDVSRHKVRCMYMSVAEALASQVRNLCSELKEMLACSTILLSWDVMKFDDASQRISFHSHPLLETVAQRVSCFSILANYQRVGWIELVSGQPVRREFRLPTIPAILLGHKSAGASAYMYVCWLRSVCLHLRVVSGCSWEALFNQTWMACVWDCLLYTSPSPRDRG